MDPDFPPALDVLKKVVGTPRKRGKGVAERSEAEAKRDYQICVFPVTDLGPAKVVMVQNPRSQEQGREAGAASKLRSASESCTRKDDGTTVGR